MGIYATNIRKGEARGVGKMEKLYAVILAGGSGTRFWPFSRELWPKQMLEIVGEDSLLRRALHRLDGFIPPERIALVTTSTLAPEIENHLAPLGKRAREIKLIKEPVGRNTAAAIGLASVYLSRIDPEAVMLAMPSDHLIQNIEAFLEGVRRATRAAQEGFLVTFGIKPTRPETGYGYIEVEEAQGGEGAPFLRVRRFVEKPDLEKAKAYLRAGNFFWNSGIFVWKVSKMMEEMARHLPALFRGLKAIEEALGTEKEEETIQTVYGELESISIDYGVLEKSERVVTIPASFDWSDIGSWSALDEVLEPDEKGNIVRGNVIAVDSEGSILFGGERIVAAIGLKGMIVADTVDATLIAPKDRAQDVRRVVEELKRNGREEHRVHRTVERPWGSYTVLEKGERYQIKRVVIHPNQKLSLQIHRHRSEHWVVISGTARVTRGNDIYYVHPNESTYIPVSTVHRLENPGRIPLQIIEVQNGDYVEEDDIERLDDDYGRA
jgi:mannose-1-phosphate guanylyltransferase/mannose-6-phosphate isomerase